MSDIELFLDTSLVKEIPESPGVYIIKSEQGEILYIGKAKNLRNRLKSYISGNSQDFLKKSMIREAKSVEIITTETELEALLLESNLIKEERPPYNIVLRDDKSYPYLRISMSEKFPRLSVARRVKHRGDFYFGPITPVEKLRTLIKTLKGAYKIAQKNDHSCQGSSNYCIYYQMNKCSAPCVGLISREEYLKMIQEIKSILQNPKKLKREIVEKINKLVKQEEFEKAITLREKLRAIELLENKQSVSELSEEFSDVIAFVGDKGIVCVHVLSVRFSNITGSRKFFFYNRAITEDLVEDFLLQYYSKDIIPDTIIMQKLVNKEIIEHALSVEKKVKVVFPVRGQKKQLLNIAIKNAELYLNQQIAFVRKNLDLLDALGSVLKITHPIRTIDAIDISHTGFENAVAGVVRYGVQGFEKSMYRRYSLGSAFEKEAMEEVSARHITLLRKSKLMTPDLFIVDGGLIQTNAVASKSSIPTIGISKEKNENVSIRRRGDVEDKIYYNNSIITVPKDVLMLIQKIRDEAHRFSVFYHRKKRNIYIMASILDRVEFIGQKRKKALFERFGTIENIKRASVEELCSIKGISPKIARLIKEKLEDYNE